MRVRARNLSSRRLAWQTLVVGPKNAHPRCIIVLMRVSLTQNRFIVVPRERGDNPFDADDIRNSISLTIAASRRIIWTSNSTARVRRT
jgi:hypothetical protein